MFQLLDPWATLESKPATIAAATAASNTNVVITLAAQVGFRHCLAQLIWSYSATPVGRLTISGLKGDDYDWDITASGPGPANFPPVVGDISTAVVITLYAGGSSVTGKLNLAYVTLPAVVVNADGRWIAGVA